jgi:hypothetical protein
MKGKLGAGSKGDIEKCSFVNRTIQIWKKLPAGDLGTLSSKPSNFRKTINHVK